MHTWMSPKAPSGIEFAAVLGCFARLKELYGVYWHTKKLEEVVNGRDIAERSAGLAEAFPWRLVSPNFEMSISINVSICVDADLTHP